MLRMTMALIIGDIHGCLYQLESLLDFTQAPSSQTIITLGDYIDRGEDSCGVIERLIKLQTTHQLVALKGNHDTFMVGLMTTAQVCFEHVRR